MAAHASKMIPRRELERGAIVFVMRPKIDKPGVQGFMVVLSTSSGASHRRIVVGKKHLPRRAARDREWSYVAKVADTKRELFEGLGPSTYMTKTRGLRHQPGVRVVAQGTYRIVEHGEHTHLDYAVDDEDGAVDEETARLRSELGIANEGSLIVGVFNPVAKWSREATVRYRGNPDDPSPFREPSIFPDELQSVFGKRRFASLDPRFLDYEGAELVLLDGQHAEERVDPRDVAAQ